MCPVGDLADVSPVIGIQLSECRGIKRLIRAVLIAGPRTRIDAGVGGGGDGVLRQADAAECVAEAIARNDPDTTSISGALVLRIKQMIHCCPVRDRIF